MEWTLGLVIAHVRVSVYFTGAALLICHSLDWAFAATITAIDDETKFQSWIQGLVFMELVSFTGIQFFLLDSFFRHWIQEDLHKGFKERVLEDPPEKDEFPYLLMVLGGLPISRDLKYIVKHAKTHKHYGIAHQTLYFINGMFRIFLLVRLGAYSIFTLAGYPSEGDSDTYLYAVIYLSVGVAFYLIVYLQILISFWNKHSSVYEHDRIK
jgi:hypothetical protein